MNNILLNDDGGAIRLAPLISFNTLVDTDMGLLNYIYNSEYHNEDIFDFTLFEEDYQKLIEKVYKRKNNNPLYCIAKNNNEFIDKCYEEFINTKEKEILNNSITTQMKMVIETFIKYSSSRVIPTILYYDDLQLEILKGESYLKKVNMVKFPLSMKEKKNYDCFYIKTVEEAEPFSTLKAKAFYFASFGMNLNDNMNDLQNSELLDKIIYNNQYAIFDMYNFLE